MPTASPAPPRRTAPGSLRALLGAGRRALLQTLLPASCALCGGASDEALCAECHAQFFGAVAPRCRQCANPLPSHGTDRGNVDAYANATVHGGATAEDRARADVRDRNGGNADACADASSMSSARHERL